MPEPLQNLFRDLRDRRLLPVVIALAVAIVAVPLLLHKGAQPAPVATIAATSASAAGVEGSDIAQPAVLADVHGIRDYHRRLKHLSERNPFQSEAPAPPDGAAATGSGSGGSGAAASGGAASSGSTGATSSSSVSVTSPSTQTTTPAPTDTTTTTTSQTTETHSYVYRWEADLKVSVPGEGTKELDGVKQFDFVPGDSHQVLEFARGDMDETKAVFLVSSDVMSMDGDGRCAPEKADCRYLLMHVGDKRTIEYGQSARRFRIKLVAVHLYRDEVGSKQASATGDAAIDSLFSGK